MWRCVRCGSVSMASTFGPTTSGRVATGRSRCRRTSTSCGRRFPGSRGAVRQERLRLREDLAVEVVEAPRDLAAQLEMGHLILADRNRRRPVRAGCRRPAAAGSRGSRRCSGPSRGAAPAAPCRSGTRSSHGSGHDHREQQVQLGVLLDLGLDEHDAALRVDPRREPVERHLAHVAADRGRVGVVGRQRVPVHDGEEAVVRRPAARPSSASAPTRCPRCSGPGRPHAGEDPRAWRRGHRVTGEAPTRGRRSRAPRHGNTAPAARSHAAVLHGASEPRAAASTSSHQRARLVADTSDGQALACVRRAPRRRQIGPRDQQRGHVAGRCDRRRTSAGAVGRHAVTLERATRRSSFVGSPGLHARAIARARSASSSSRPRTSLEGGRTALRRRRRSRDARCAERSPRQRPRRSSRNASDRPRPSEPRRERNGRRSGRARRGRNGDAAQSQQATGATSCARAGPHVRKTSLTIPEADAVPVLRAGCGRPVTSLVAVDERAVQRADLLGQRSSRRSCGRSGRDGARRCA